MAKFKRTINFNKPKDYIFQYLYNFDLHKLWVKELIKIEGLELSNNNTNKNFNLYIKKGNKTSKYQGKILSCITNQELKIELKNNFCITKVSYFLTKNQSNTSLIYEIDIKYNTVFRNIIFILFGYIFSLISLTNKINTLKKLIEETSDTIN